MGQSWQVQPYAVWDAPEQRWIQLSLAGRADSQNLILTLKVGAGAGIQHVVMALSSWLANPANSSDILNVA